MPWIIGGAILGGSLIGGFGANRASGQAADAANNAAGVQQHMFDTTQKNLAPWMQQGQMALGEIGQQFGTPTSPGNQPFDLNKFQQSPAYQFNLQEGQKAIDKSANARGNFYAPQTLQDISKFSQGMASNEFQNAFSNYNVNQNNLFSRLQTLSGSGQNAANNLGSIGAQTAGQIGGNIVGAGDARAAGTLGVASSINGGIGTGVNAFMQNQALQQLMQQQNPMYTTSPQYNPNYGGGAYGGSSVWAP